MQQLLQKLILSSLLLMMIFSCQSPIAKPVNCSIIETKILGKISWKKRNRKTKKIETFSRIKPIGNKWDANDNSFKSIIIHTKKNINEVIVSKIINGKKEQVQHYQVKKMKDGQLSIKDLVFTDLVSGKIKPFQLSFDFRENKKSICIKNINIKKAD